MLNPDPLLSLAEAGAYLGGISPRTVSRLIARGELRGTHVGRTPMVRRTELEAYLDAATK